MVALQLFVYFLLLLPLCSWCDLITVETSRGPVQGFDQDFGDDKSQLYFGYGQIFLGIPYAKPPLGERRFTLPEDICQYNDKGEVHNATYYRSRCYQINFDDLSEDCLYLNVMTPNVTGSYPVMVYIHGGALTVGGAEQYHWKGAVRNLVSRGVVVVTIQYRLGVIGFFTTFTESFPPNRGIFDQILALRWVNEEIANFGGDTSRITIFGQSAGACSVSHLSLSPLARGLFHQLSQTSGAALGEEEMIEDPRWSIHKDRAQKICGINSTDWGSFEKDKELLDCLVQADPNDLIAYDFADNMVWNVAIDGSILPDYAENLAKLRPKYPVLMGDLLDDYAFMIPGVQDGDISQITSQTNQDEFQGNWPNYDDETAKKVSDMMLAAYSNGTLPAEDDHLGWTRLTTDAQTGAFFSYMMVRDAQWHQKAGNDKVWLFTLTHRSMLPFGVDIDGWIPVAHGSDMPYLWFMPKKWESFNASDSDFYVADALGQIWTDFAKNGELPLPKAGSEMNYIDIGDLITLRTNWQATADKVFNQQLPAFLGEFPPQPMSDESWSKIRALGEKVTSKWNSMSCPGRTTASPSKESTTSGASSLSTMFPIIATIVLRIF